MVPTGMMIGWVTARSCLLLRRKLSIAVSKIMLICDTQNYIGQRFVLPFHPFRSTASIEEGSSSWLIIHWRNIGSSVLFIVHAPWRILGGPPNV